MAKNKQRTPLYSQIRTYINDQIQQLNWKPGDQLPSENELAAQFNVSRITVKTALSELIEEGIIFRVQGKGTFVSTDPSGEPKIYESKLETNATQKLVAFLIPRMSNTFTLKLLDGVEAELAKQGYRVVFCKTHDSQSLEKKILLEMIEMGVRGVIIYPVDGVSYNEEILRMKLNNYPFVVVDRYFRGIDTNSVCTDNFEGARMATDTLISLGHSRIGFLSSQSAGTTSIEDRLSGYERALADRNIPIEHRLRLADFDVEQLNIILEDGIPDEKAVRDIQAFLQSNPDLTALFAINPAIGLTAIAAAKGIGLEIPNDLSIIFFDNYEMSGVSAIPPTCIAQEEREIGHEAARLLLSIMENPDQEPRRILLPPKLILRKSTGPARDS